MSLPTTSRNWRRTQDGKSLELVTEELPKTLGPKEVLVRTHVVSLNFRDVAMLNDNYPLPSAPCGIPASDASATVLATGSSVTTLKPADRVSPSFFQNLPTGREKCIKPPLSLGGDVDGVLREFAIFPEEVLTKVPEYLSHEEVSTIACAGVTAWVALGLGDGDWDWKGGMGEGYAVMQGTGGVSVFATVLCVAAGIVPIITSSSDEKLEEVKKLGTGRGVEILGINYRVERDWAAEVLRLTKGIGVDVVINNVGSTAMGDCIESLCPRGGIVSVVGILGGIPETMTRDWLIEAQLKVATIKNIGVGSTRNQRELCEFLEKHRVDLKPLVDRVFEFEDARAAFEFLAEGKHVGKVVIKVED